MTVAVEGEIAIIMGRRGNGSRRLDLRVYMWDVGVCAWWVKAVSEQGCMCFKPEQV